VEKSASRTELFGDKPPERGVLGEIAAQIRKERGYNP
jgi:hypothetical protein